MIRLSGIAVSPGMAWGPAALLLQRPLALRHAVASVNVPRELARLDEARDTTRQQLERIHRKVLASAGPDLAYLFQAQLLMLDDELLVPRARAVVSADCANAEWALQRAFEEFCAIFMDADDAYLKERQGDVADVVGRLRRNLRPARQLTGDLLLDLDQPSILMTDDLPPSVAGQLDRRRVIGLAIDTGSRTHHSAILARSLGLPAVASLGTATQVVRPGTLVLVDGYAGEIIIDPDRETIDQARMRRDRIASGFAITVDRDVPATTLDGVGVHFEANIELPEEIEAARAYRAEGVGLFRSEFMLGSQAVGELDEESQYQAYRALVERMAPRPVTIRTFDVDEGQALAAAAGAFAAPGDVSRGPLGLRAVRLSLSQPDVFATQLRALTRAACHGSMRVLFPFVSCVEELREAKGALQAARVEVATRTGQSPNIAIGVMIEVPSAALTADLLADDADFFSIGTNDLIQYCLAVDRTDGRVARLYQPLHPAIVRVVRQVVRVARHRRKGVEVCGEMAADPAALLLLLGLGVRDFSMSPSSIPLARQIVRQVSLGDLRRAVAEIMRLSTADEIGTYLASAYPTIVQRPPGRDARSGREGETGER